MATFSAPSFRFTTLFFAAATCVLGATHAYAQPNLPSPLSRYGVGELNLASYGQQRVMGGLGQAWQPLTALNPANPGSLGSLRLSTFEFGVYAGSGLQDDGTGTSRQPIGNLSHLALGFPIWEKKMALSIGLQAFSRVNYSISQIPDSVTELNPEVARTGEGGLNQLTMGLGYNVVKNLNVGVSVSRLFGTIRHQVFSEYGTGTTLNNFLDTRNRLGAFQPKIGAQYTLPLKNDKKLLVGLTYVPQTNLNNSLTTTLARYRVNGTTLAATVEDTIFFSETNPEARLSSELHAGLSYAPNGRWWFGGEYSTTQSQQTLLDESGQWQRSRTSMALGVTHTPKAEAGQKGYFRRVTYRAGLRMTQLPIEINGQGIDETSISAGVVLPFFKTFSVLTVGGELGQRSGTGNYKEQYVMMTLSATLSDRWFIKRKYD